MDSPATRRRIVPTLLRAKIVFSRKEAHRRLQLEIVQAGDPVLRQLARPIRPDEIESPEFQQTIADMLEPFASRPA